MIDPTRNRVAALEGLLPKVQGKPLAMVHLANLFHSEGQPERAFELCMAAYAAAPDDSEVATLVASVLSADVPAWHFNIVRDEARNRAYESALTRAIQPGCRVLDIGTGTGLLAMMAARAGAGRVIACEANPIIARMAQEVIAANGYADRVQVVTRHSTALDVERDLGGPVDVLVTEIFSNNGVGEGAIPVFEDAWDRLLAPDARVIPARVRVLVALAEDRRLDHRRMGEVSGFDLSRFNLVARPRYQMPVGAARLELRSDPATIFTFDFRYGRRFASSRRSVDLTTHGGPVNGVAQWIGFDLDDHDAYQIHPGRGAESCWGVMFHPLRHPIDAVPERRVCVHGRHDRQTLHVWASDDPGAGQPQS